MPQALSSKSRATRGNDTPQRECEGTPIVPSGVTDVVNTCI
jgi:hypothetical protein